MSCPAGTGSGASVFVTAMSERRLTVVVAVAELLERSVSWPALATVAVFEIVAASAVPAATRTTRVNVVVPPAPMARLGWMQLTVPFVPTVGLVQVHPADPAPPITSDWNGVAAGSASVMGAFGAAFAPLLLTVIV